MGPSYPIKSIRRTRYDLYLTLALPTFYNPSLHCYIIILFMIDFLVENQTMGSIASEISLGKCISLI